MLTCIQGNPYRDGASIEAGGFPITTVHIPDDATEIPSYKNAGLKFDGEILFPSTLKKIGDYAFWNQKDLYYVEFPEGLEEIGDGAFGGCEVLTFNPFPASLKSIGYEAFNGCESQKSVILPENLTSLGGFAFANMKSLEKAVLLAKIDSVPVGLCSNCPNLNTLFLPTEATVIGQQAFEGTIALEEVILPKKLEIIRPHAFGRTYEVATPSKLNKINFPESLRTIEDYAFDGQSFHSLIFNEGLESIGHEAFSGNSELNNVVFPSTLKSIGTQAFNGCTQLQKVVIPDNVTSLGTGAFTMQGGELIIGDGITEIDSTEPYGFGEPAIFRLGKNVKILAVDAIGYSNLSVFEVNATRPASLTSISSGGSVVFPITSSQAEKITFLVPDGSKDYYSRNPRWAVFDIIEQSQADVTVYVNGTPISEEARVQSGLMPSKIVKMKVSGTLADADWRLIRENFASLISLDLSAITNTEIPVEGLKSMTQLTELVLPSKLTKIGENAFRGCSLMDIPSIPETVTEIGDNAFYSCNRLSISKLPDALETIGSHAFGNCTSLRSLTAGENLTQLNGSKIFIKCSSLEFVDFGSTKLTSIEYCTFSDCTSLTTIALPECLEKNGGQAFHNTALEAIDLPASLNQIGEEAFQGTKLRAVTIPEGVTDIPRNTFANCRNLLSVNFPGSMTSIGAGVFSGTEKVTGISCVAVEAPEASTGALSALSIKRCSLTVPQQSFRSYLNAAQWGRLASLLNRIVVEIPEDIEVTTIPEEEYEEIVQEESWMTVAEAPETEEPAGVAMRKAARASLVKGTNFTRLFNGAQMASPDTPKGTRIFINVKQGAKVKSVLYNGIEMISQIVDNSLLLPGNAIGTLQILSDSSALEDVLTEDNEVASCTAFDLTGRLVYSGARANLETSVTPGLYIVRSGTSTKKILVK